MRRRDFIAGIAASTAAWPLATRAQQPALPVIGYLSSAVRDQDAGRLRAFLQGLSETGYVEGRNIAIEYWRSSPLVFSLVPRCHGLCGSQK